jgi:hypothetical protein
VSSGAELLVSRNTAQCCKTELNFGSVIRSRYDELHDIDSHRKDNALPPVFSKVYSNFMDMMGYSFLTLKRGKNTEENKGCMNL